MTWQDARDIVIRHTGHERYRHLCSQDNTLKPPNGPEEYRALMIQRAHELEGTEPATTPMQGVITFVPCCPGPPLPV